MAFNAPKRKHGPHDTLRIQDTWWHACETRLEVTSVSIYINLIQIECQNVRPSSRSWPAGFATIFFFGSWSCYLNINLWWWVVTRYNKSENSRHSDDSLLFSCTGTALKIARHEPLPRVNDVFYIVWVFPFSFLSWTTGFLRSLKPVDFLATFSLKKIFPKLWKSDLEREPKLRFGLSSFARFFSELSCVKIILWLLSIG